MSSSIFFLATILTLKPIRKEIMARTSHLSQVRKGTRELNATYTITKTYCKVLIIGEAQPRSALGAEFYFPIDFI